MRRGLITLSVLVTSLAGPLATPARAAAAADPVVRIADATPSASWGPARVRAPLSADAGAVVAVVDTGVDPGLGPAVLPGTNLVNDRKSGDPEGHGTEVAGVVLDYCRGCRILPVRVLGADGTGLSSTVASGITWAADHGAAVINLSLAAAARAQSLDSAIAYAQGKGALVVAAAGNQADRRDDLTAPRYPAATNGVIGVAASDPDDRLYSWSYRGSWVQVAAPGCDRTGGCGTSFATPVVAAVLALGVADHPTASLAAVLESTTVPVTGGTIAHGRVDAQAFLDELDGVVRPQRVAGSDRVATAIALSQRTFRSATSVVIARSDSYADALAAAPLAGKLRGPVLLTSSSSLDSRVADEVARLGATDAWLIGGDGALSPNVERALGVRTRRIAGTSRIDTAARIALELRASSVYIASATGWADAVAASGLAAFTHAPILLVDGDRVPAPTADALAALQPSSVTVVGGRAAVPDSVVDALHATRLGGATRYETSDAVAAAAVAAGADASRLWLATGADWPDALTAGPAAAGNGAVLRLVNGTVPQLRGGVKELVVVGGEAAVRSAAR